MMWRIGGSISQVLQTLAANKASKAMASIALLALLALFRPCLQLLVQRYSTCHEENTCNLQRGGDLTQDNNSNYGGRRGQ
jgi:hypothetical protein